MSDMLFDDLSILTIDDSPHMLTILRECLKAFGANKIHEARDAVEALEIVRDNTIDLIIADYLMPQLDGREFIQLMRSEKNERLRHMPIILLTAHTERDIVIAARDTGVSDVMQKPVSAAKLYDRIVRVLNSKRDFIDVPAFTGPDRRTDREPGSDWDGVDHRS